LFRHSFFQEVGWGRGLRVVPASYLNFSIQESTKISTTKVEFFLVATHFIPKNIRIFVG
jgi:hypothetical protein